MGFKNKLFTLFVALIAAGTKHVVNPELKDCIRTSNLIALFATLVLTPFSLFFLDEKIMFWVYLLGSPSYLLIILFNHFGHHKFSRFYFSVFAITSIFVLNGLVSNYTFVFIKIAAISAVILPTLLFAKHEKVLSRVSMLYNLVLFTFSDRLVALIPQVTHFEPEGEYLKALVNANGLFSLIVIYLAVSYYKGEKEIFREKILSKQDELKSALEELSSLNENLEFEVKLRTESLAKANQSLAEQNERLQNYIFNLSHEIRPDAANILGLIELLKNEDKRTEVIDLINLLEISAAQLDNKLFQANENLQALNINRSK
ncbi:MAG: hypothetical protein ACXITV_02905 [Luteibaculaceae bacterium]